MHSLHDGLLLVVLLDGRPRHQRTGRYGRWHRALHGLRCRHTRAHTRIAGLSRPSPTQPTTSTGGWLVASVASACRSSGRTLQHMRRRCGTLSGGKAPPPYSTTFLEGASTQGFESCRHRLLACLVLFAGLSACRAESDPAGEASSREHCVNHRKLDDG